MKFFNLTTRLAREVFSLKRYKKMNKVLAVFLGIFLAPFFVGFIFAIGMLYLASIFFAIISAPLSYLHGVVREEGERVKTATQVVIYLISWPLIFFLYFWYAFLTLWIYIFYFLSVCDGYIVAVGGFIFHIDPLYEDISKDLEGESFKIRPLIYIIVAGLCLFITLILIIVGVVSEEPFDWVTACSVVFFVYELFTIIYVPIAFNHKKELPAPAPKAAR